MATIEDFQKIEMRVGRVLAVEDFPEARNPSYKLTIDFGAHGTRRSSAAVRRWYQKSDLQHRLVVCVTNFPPRRIATFDSEVLTLGAIEEDGRVVLLRPDDDAELGSLIG
ncbi:MAG TPA: tRNA-binding protein [Candidatus Limnocylindria bacterium]